MKLMIVLLLLLVGCSREQPQPAAQSIIVGMTYDEVEKIRGKPQQITRGVTYLEPLDVEAMSTEEFDLFLETLPLESAKTSAGEPGFWSLPRTVETQGQLLYVTWVYDSTAVDTFFTFQGVRTPQGSLTPLRVDLQVFQSYCVVFDASSGRTVESGLYPFKILALPSDD